MEINQNDLKHKHDKAIYIVKRNLRTINRIINEPKFDTFTLMPSFSTSLIRVSSDKKNSRTNNRVLRSIQRAYDNELLVERYLSYLKTLDKRYYQIIHDHYFYNINFSGIGGLTERLNMDSKKIYELANKAYEILAVLDINVEYSINDYIQHLKLNYKETYSIKQSVLLILRTDKDYLRKKIELTNLFDTATINRLYEGLYLDEKVEKTGYQYRLELRAIYIIAFLHKDIELDEKNFDSLMKKTGRGYKKAVSEAKKVKRKNI